MQKSLYSEQVIVLGVVQFIEWIALSIPLSYFPNYAVSLGASVAYIGLFSSSFMLMLALLSPSMVVFQTRLGEKSLFCLD